MANGSISRRSLVKIAVAAPALMTLTACSGSGSESASTPGGLKKIKIGVRSDMVDQANAVIDACREAGFELEPQIFDDSIQPNVALGEKSIDVNWYQHEPYLKNYNASNGTDFVMVRPKTFAPLFAMYSNKWTKVEELPDGATIGLCNDASNQGRGLNMLQSQGLIKLPSGLEVPSIHDIEDNPHSFQFTEAEMQILPQSLPDVDAIALAAGHMVNAGLDASKYLCKSNDDEEYAVGMVVRKENAQEEWPAKLATAVQCDALAEYFEKEKKGTQVPLWK
ncbi:MAG: MetQ/NlpA family ABC transporter substrate-binding protein [Atopobiaceae bacterium]|jgi:D-methionine transport system substrate-binding protein